MAELTLPANSIVNPKGKHHAAPAGTRRSKRVKIYRYDPDSGENPRVDSYDVNMDECGPMVLDVLIKIKSRILRFYDDLVGKYGRQDILRPYC